MRAHIIGTGGIFSATEQSTRFSAAHIPYGRYELCVVANGIASQCIGFDRERPDTACACNELRECAARVIAAASPEFIELEAKIHRMSRHVERLSKLVKIDTPHRHPKDVKKRKDGEARNAHGRRGRK